MSPTRGASGNASSAPPPRAPTPRKGECAPYPATLILAFPYLAGVIPTIFLKCRVSWL